MKSFFVEGHPVAQGRISHFQNRGYYTNDKELKPWRELIGWKARQAQIPFIADGPISIELDFIFVRPASSKREFPSIRPDIDKLERSVLDALTGILYKDDGQVCKVSKTKIYGLTEGVRIAIAPMKLK